MAAPLSGITIVETTAVDAPVAVAIAASFCAKIAGGLGANICLASETAVRHGWPAPLRIFLDDGKTIMDDRSAIEPVDATITDRATVDNISFPQVPIAVAVSTMSSRMHDLPQSEFTLAARTGVLDMIGDPDRAPLMLPGHQPAFAAGLAAFTGLAAALFRRRLQPDYCERIDANIEDVLLWLNWKSILGESWGVETPTRKGRLTEWPILRCADGWAALVFRDVDWPALKQLLSDVRLDEPRFESREGRQAHRGELFDIIEEAFAHYDRAELMRRSLALRLPIGPVIEPQELPTDPQYAARGVFEKMRLPDGTEHQMPRLPVFWHRPVLSAEVGNAA